MSYPVPVYPAMSLLAGFQKKFTDQLAGRGEPDPLAFGCDLHDTLITALGEIYRGCRAQLGELCFTELADQYLRRYPPAIQRLDRFADQMAQFVAVFTPVRHMEQLPALARLEWAIFRAALAGSAKAFDQQGFAQQRSTSTASVSLQLAPGLGLLQAEYAVDLLWQHHLQQLGVAGRKYLDHGGVRLVVLVHEKRLRIERLNSDSWRCLHQLLKDGSLSALASVLGQQLG